MVSFIKKKQIHPYHQTHQMHQNHQTHRNLVSKKHTVNAEFAQITVVLSLFSGIDSQNLKKSLYIYISISYGMMTLRAPVGANKT